jgi:hypothetical protein
MAKITNKRMAGADHAVLTLTSKPREGMRVHRREPCPQCPWRKDAVGVFPAEAFKHSASTAYDMALNTFACHDSGSKAPADCAGFLLRGADHNLAIRLAHSKGKLGEVSDGGHELFDSYAAMAIANGVDPDDPVLAPCR